MRMLFLVVLLLFHGTAETSASRASLAQRPLARSLSAIQTQTVTVFSLEELVAAITDDRVTVVVVGTSLTMVDAAWQGVSSIHWSTHSCRGEGDGGIVTISGRVGKVLRAGGASWRNRRVRTSYGSYEHPHTDTRAGGNAVRPAAQPHADRSGGGPSAVARARLGLCEEQGERLQPHRMGVQRNEK